MKPVTRLLFYCLVLLLSACSPKMPTPTTPQEKPKAPVSMQGDDTKLSPCPNFLDAPDPDQAETNFVLYKDFMRANDIDKAYELWQKVYAVAPAADGRRNTVYSDGIYFMEYYLSQTQDPVRKEEYVDRIFTLYDEIETCFEGDGFAEARKAFDLYYKYPERSDTLSIYRMFKNVIDKEGEKTHDFVINPFTALLLRLHSQDKIPTTEAQHYAAEINRIINYGTANCKGSACDRWNIIEGYAPRQLENFETVKGFYDCAYYETKYYPEYLENSQDCDVIRTIGSYLRWGGCDVNGEKLQTLAEAYRANQCGGAPSSPVAACYISLRDGNYQASISCFEEAISNSSDPEDQAKYKLLIAKIYYAHLKNYTRARQYAREAADLKPNWGEPFLLIGRLYASSGPLCGSGTGWNSQVVVWPAIDMWNRAKRVDPATAAEANKWIGRYRKYMPSYSEVFQRNKNRGDSYFVGCWIQERTTIRTAD